MSTYIPSSKDGRLKEQVGNNMMYFSQPPNSSIDIPNVGILDSANEFALVRDCRRHEMLLMDQTGSHIPSSGTQFQSDQYQNANVGFTSLVDETTQDSVSWPYGIRNVISDSVYLKTAQQLLDEVVNVKKTVKRKYYKQESMNDSHKVFGESNNQQDSSLLSAAEKQDLQNKMTKLSSMLNDVDRRYKQYYHQLQIITSSFDIIVGCGAAKTYTTLSHHTISSYFRCLRDSINSQIKLISRSLGETESNGNGIAISRLRFVDQRLRQQKLVQDVGIMPQHIWRPQRGLPENCVSILRAWLFEHFLHPYPKDSEKTMLARQTGLTRGQVSNWFINARVRLWKPMVEEIYQEESADAAMDSNSSSEIAPKKTSFHQAQDMDMHQSATSSEQIHDTKMANASPYSDFLMKGAVVNEHNVLSNTVINKRVSLTLHDSGDVYESKTVDYMVL